MERSFAELARALATGTMSRRQALAWIGATLAGAFLGRVPEAASAVSAPGETAPGVPAQHGTPLRGIALTQKGRSLEGRFGLMFKKLPAFECPDELLTGLAARMEETPPNVPGDSSMPAGFVFLGQFVDHDLTFDNTPIPEQQEDPDARTNFRSARFELDSVYGNGPSQEKPDFYDPNDPAKLHIAGLGNPRVPDDLPRDGAENNAAIIGDPRDDENLITSQLHLAFRKFHNALVDHVRAQGLRGPNKVFAEAQRLCRWHYQWMVVHDLLPRLVGQNVVDKLLQEEERPGGPAKVKLDFYKPKNPNKPMMPIEFAVAAYRFGHSMLRRGYVINKQGQSAILFGKNADDFPKDEFVGNLNGGRPLRPELEIAWRHFFEIPGANDPVNYARPIDSNLSGPLSTLPFVSAPPVSLAERNLLRGKSLGLPAGQQVAQEMGVQALSVERLGLGANPGWVAQGRAPLWFYILKEAELQQGGERLGAVGGRIVAEVFLGLLERDANSYLRRDPSFRPHRPIAPTDGQFGIGDLLRFAGVA